MTPAREPAIAYLQSRGSEGLRSPPISALSPPTVVTVSRAGDLIFNTLLLSVRWGINLERKYSSVSHIVLGAMPDPSVEQDRLYY